MKRPHHADVTGQPSLASLLTIANAILKTSPRGLFVVLAPLRDEEFYFLVESGNFFAFVVTQYVDACGRWTSWQCRLLAVRVSSPRTATSVRTLVHVAQAVPQVRAVPNANREVFGTLTCNRVDTGASGRRVSFFARTAEQLAESSTNRSIQHAHSGIQPARI